ncbi:MAG: hypothetical protein EP348_01565 [Alphaproteobacteria bacterium]|nr:MAG: hypothetical protein EP348_01565 [Alphaproteobacteria bacterium]
MMAVMAAAFLASLVEMVEALTIILAVGVVRGWRPALIGAGAGILALAILLAFFGSLLSTIPIGGLQIVIGILLLLFGMRWLKKAVLRSAGVIALHDETLAFEKERRLLETEGLASGPLDPVAIMTSFKAVLLEGLEVIFIVIATGSAGGMILPATLGAAVALLLVLLLGLLLHRPLANVPENLLKFVVGILLSAFGLFWAGEGAGLNWPGEDWSILGLIAGLTLTALLAVRFAKAQKRGGVTP